MKTTKKDFKIFKKECRRFAKILGLTGYDINILHVKLANGIAANCATDFEQHLSVIRFTTDRDENHWFSKKLIKQYARHEIYHVLFDRITFIAKARFIDDVEVDEEEHNLIRTLENVGTGLLE